MELSACKDTHIIWYFWFVYVFEEVTLMKKTKFIWDQ